ncbi:MAG TPA: hypothetical protein VIK53_02930 [Verrucomicrobiae bacterium]
MKENASAAAGVDIDLGNRVKATLPQLLASTHRREVLGKVGGLGQAALRGKTRWQKMRLLPGRLELQFQPPWKRFRACDGQRTSCDGQNWPATPFRPVATPIFRPATTCG